MRNSVERAASASLQSKAGKRAWANDLRKRLISTAAERASGPTGHWRIDPTRTTARALAAEASWSIDNLWGASAEAASGPIQVIDFFSGCGGMSAGFRAVNSILPLYRLLGAADIDKVANASYAANFGVQPQAADVSELAKSQDALKDFAARAGLRPDRPLVLIGCASCQGFSSHRNAAGASDERNSLLLDFATIADALRPDAVLMENVPELLTDRFWPLVRQVLEILQGSGYTTHVAVHNTAAFGTPQERFRALILAMRHPFSAPEAFLKRPQYRTVRDAIGDLPVIAAGEAAPSDPLHRTANHRESTLDVIRAVSHDGGHRPSDVGPESLRRLDRRQGKPGYEDIYGRLWWDRPSITITAYARNPASGRFVHPEQDRGLSIREAALLQGFPRGYHLKGSLDECFRQIGNAVPPTLAAYIAMHIAGELVSDEQPVEPAGVGIAKPVGKSFSRMIPALKAGHDVAGLMEARGG